MKGCQTITPLKCFFLLAQDKKIGLMKIWPGNKKGPLIGERRGTKLEQFSKQNSAQVALLGDFCHPFHAVMFKALRKALVFL